MIHTKQESRKISDPQKKQMLHVGNIFTNHVSRSVAVFGPLNGHRGASGAWHFALKKKDKRMIQSVITEKTHWPFFQDRTSKNTRHRTTFLEMEHHGTALTSHSLLAEEVFSNRTWTWNLFCHPYLMTIYLGCSMGLEYLPTRLT